MLRSAECGELDFDEPALAGDTTHNLHVVGIAGDCKLATRIVQILPAVVSGLPPCIVRASCRWYAQEGGAACLRCPQIVTLNQDPSEELKMAAGYTPGEAGAAASV